MSKTYQEINEEARAAAAPILAGEVKIDKVAAEELPKGGYRYVALLSDGTAVVIRAKATRLYERAFFYSAHVASGKRGLSRYFSFGKNPGSYYRDDVVGVWKVELVQK